MKYPRHASQLADLRQACKEMVLTECVPSTPMLNHTDRIYTQGSCFAATLQQELECRGIKAEHTGVVEEINSPQANAMFFQSTEADAIKRNLPTVKAFIFTLGIAPHKSTIAENAGAILAIIAMIREHSADCIIVLTVSPVPMNRSEYGSAVLGDIGILTLTVTA